MMSNLQEYLTVDIDVEYAKNMALSAEKLGISRKNRWLFCWFSSGTNEREECYRFKAEQDRWSGYMMARGLGGLYSLNIT